MEAITLYKYIRQDGGITTTPNIPEDGYECTLFRIIADEGKSITKDNVDFYKCIDVDSIEGWIEVDDPNNEEDIINNEEVE